jgi:FixJ family two-component response regulator
MAAGIGRGGDMIHGMQGIVHVVDDDTSYRVALGRLLRASGLEPRLYASATEYLAGDDADGPACLVLDVCMPGLTGLDLHEALRARVFAHPVVFLSGHGDIPTTVRVIREGAVDFLTKPVDGDTLLRAIDLALSRDARGIHDRGLADARAARYRTLTARERQVMAGVAVGRLNKQIAYALDTAERTVKTHRARVMAKMGVRTVPELVHLADQLSANGVLLEAAPGDGPKDALRSRAACGQ